MTSMKSRPPLVPAAQANISSNHEDDMTVEQYLQNQLDLMIKQFTDNSEARVNQLKAEFKEGRRVINEMMSSSVPEEVKRIVVTLKVIVGSHLGQKFRLEPSTEDGEDVFKIGRSTGKAFKEKGVSLYKDKEISTTHARIEMRNGQVFLIDNKSTNGTLLNNVEIEPEAPLRLQNGDVVGMGNTELLVQISDLEGQENVEY